jgi:hypothetical protein
MGASHLRLKHTLSAFAFVKSIMHMMVCLVTQDQRPCQISSICQRPACCLHSWLLWRAYSDTYAQPTLPSFLLASAPVAGRLRTNNPPRLCTCPWKEKRSENASVQREHDSSERRMQDDSSSNGQEKRGICKNSL